MKRIAARGLPDAPLDAQAAFVAAHQSGVAAALSLGEDVLVELDPTDHKHREWRRAAVAMLARAHAPARVNFVAGIPGPALEEAAVYLVKAPGVTGQYLECAREIGGI